ncbi:MAG TPA: HAD-IA family hydrolase [Gemmatimonadaceae bacterium]|jgi:putative hydrolase of the HAD superfamily|nr:HAD-IA family hydrolase [Gemmatimonadaceae bacterium]
MTTAIEVAFFDIGGVLGSNGWDREQRGAAIERFRLDEEDFQYRHEETVGALESGSISLDEYLDVTVFCEPRDFTREDFKSFMFAQSERWPDSIAVAQTLAAAGRARLATLNNESEALNVHRIAAFGLCGIFPVFFSSCWLGVRKPTLEIYHRALGMAQVDPRRALFVDDRRQNLSPAATLGMTTIHFQSADQLRGELRALGLLD